MTRTLRSRPARGVAAIAAVAIVVGLLASGPAAKPTAGTTTMTTSAGSTTVAASTGLAAPAGPAQVSTTTTTIDSVPPGTPIAVPSTGLGMGARGAAVLAVKQRLAQLRYDPGPIDDQFDFGAYYAVVAFQKVHGVTPTGRVSPALAAALATDGLPAPMIPAAEPTRAEIDLTRQVLFFWQGAKLVRILPVSSGFGGHYCGDDGSCGIAVTPVGSFRATSKIWGLHKSPLGLLWNPVFFNGGIAVHGEPSVPVVPASHGCIRIPMQDSVWMYNQLTLGTPVYVRDATHVPVPFDQGGKLGPRQPGGTPPTIPRRPTTTVPAAAAPTTKPR